jgi:hypothetical protein
VVSFPQVFPPKSCPHLSPHPHALHDSPISFLSISSPAQQWVRSIDHEAPDYQYKLNLLAENSFLPKQYSRIKPCESRHGSRSALQEGILKHLNLLIGTDPSEI